MSFLLALWLVQAPKQDLQVSGHAGFGGVVVRGEWTPLTIDLDHRGNEDLDLVLSVTWGQSGGVQESDKPTLGSLYGKQGPVHRLPASIAARSRKRLSLSVRAPEIDRLNAWVFAESAKTGRTLASGELLARSLPARQRLIVVVGRDTLDWPEGLTAQAAPEHLPEDWRGYAGAEAVLWLDAKGSELRSQAQADALRTWIQFGGCFVTARATEIGLAGTPIAELLPVAIRGARQLPGFGAPLAALAERPSPPGPVLVLDSVPERGAVRLAQDGVPLVVQGSFGMGRSIFIAFDPAKEPFAGWSGAGRFWSWAVPLSAPADAPPSSARPPAEIGSITLANQAGQFPDIPPPAIGGLFVLIVIYLVIVGPFDYFVLRKLGRLELTWITFPAYVVLFTLLILFAGGAFIERAAYQRELLVVDRAAGSPQERRRALSAVLAPRNQRYRLQDVEPISSNYLPSQFGSLDLGSAVLQRKPEILLEDWTVARGATGLVAADRAVAAKPGLSWTLRSGTLDVRNDTGATLEGAVLFSKGGAQEVDPIPPGASVVRLQRHRRLDEFLQSQGALVDPQGNEVDSMNPRYYGERNSQSIGEAALDAQIRRTLLALSFQETLRTGSGFARGLATRRFLEGGGSVLVVWEKPSRAEVAYEPLPSRFTGLAMIRYFQGPPK